MATFPRTARTRSAATARPPSGTAATVALAAALLAALVAAGFFGGQAGADELPPFGPDDVPPPMVDEPLGPHPVGVRSVDLEVRHQPEPMRVEVWYPADPDDAAQADPAAYEVPDEFMGLDLDDVDGIDADLADGLPAELAVDAPAVADGAFPVVVFSHGLGAIRFQSTFLTEHLASNGYVVVAPDHQGTSYADDVVDPDADGDDDLDFVDDLEAIAASLTLRPVDVATVLDALETGALADGALLGRVDTRRAGVTGHSMGGYTALAAATGKGAAEPYDVAPDPRIAATAPLAPATSMVVDLLSPTELARLHQPTLLMAGTEDAITPIDPNVLHVVEHAAADPLYRLDLDGADHGSFLDELLHAGWQELMVDEPADGPYADLDTAHRVTLAAVIGLMLDEVPPQQADGVAYGDVSPTSPHRGAVHHLTLRGVVEGVGAGAFDPAATVTRGQLASKLARALGLDEVDDGPFTDVDGDVHAGAINALAATDEPLVLGYADGTFRPDEQVRRDHAALVLHRWADPDPAAQPTFDDLHLTPHRDEVEAAAAAGLVLGTTETTFEPLEGLRRDQLASLLSRALTPTLPPATS